MEVRVRSLKFRYALHGRADAAEIHRMLEDCPLQAQKIDTNGPYAEVFFEQSVPVGNKDMQRFVDRMNEFGYRLGANNES
jgi:hypothetical protein